MSINIPTTIKIIFIRRRITYLFVEMDIIPVEIVIGIPEYAIERHSRGCGDQEQDNTTGTSTAYKDLHKRFYSDTTVTDREDQAVKKNTNASTSVAVKIPPTIPPITMMIRSRLE